MKFEIGIATDAGRKRRGINQDYIGISRPSWFSHHPILLAVADGMGGYNGGEIASRAVVKTFLRCYQSAKIRKDYPAVLSDCLASAHQKVCQLAQRRKEIAAMGSTLV